MKKNTSWSVMNLHINVYNIMYERNMLVKELADKADILPNAMSAMINGKKSIGLKTLLRICNALECTPNDLLRN